MYQYRVEDERWVYENNVLQEYLLPEDVHLLREAARKQRFEYEDREVCYDDDDEKWVITDQETGEVLVRATSPGQALQWLNLHN